MSQIEVTKIEARCGRGFQVTAGSILRVINSAGSQVVGTWAFAGSNIDEYMSMEHTRIHSKSSRPVIGTVFYTNLHEPILELTDDRSPGVHDWFLAACNQQRYELLGHEGEHANCADNLHAAVNGFGHSLSFVPCPLNLFENVPVMYGEAMKIEQPVAMPGDSVSFRALIDCLVVLSACPQDILPTNGPDLTPRSIEVETIKPSK